MKRSKTYPRCFWGSHNVGDKHAYVYHFGDMDVQKITKTSLPPFFVKFGEDEKSAAFVAKKALDAQKKGMACVAYAYNPTTQQSEVVSFSEVGVYADLARRSDIVRNVSATRHDVYKTSFAVVVASDPESGKHCNQPIGDTDGDEVIDYMDDFSMAEAFAPVADVEYHGRLPDITDMYPEGYCLPE